jgi:hypothetical protein
VLCGRDAEADEPEAGGAERVSAATLTKRTLVLGVVFIVFGAAHIVLTVTNPPISHFRVAQGCLMIALGGVAIWKYRKRDTGL